MRALGLQERNIVADLGAGTGFYSVPLGHMVPQGKVYAVEIAKDFLELIDQKVKEANLSNIEVIWGNVEHIGGTKIGDKVVDAVIASNVLFQVENRENFILEIKRILKPKGKVLLIDWSEGGILNAKKILSKEKTLAMFEKKGFKKEREIDAGVHHYGIILTVEKVAP
mgnify:FL=1